jgi:hypothetical protein
MQPKKKKKKKKNTVPAFGDHPRALHNPIMPDHISLCLTLSLKYLTYDFDREQNMINEI